MRRATARRSVLEMPEASAAGLALRGRQRVPVPALEVREDAVPAPRTSWGSLPYLAVSTALGLVTISIAYTGARLSAPWGEALFWAGLLSVYIPPVLLLVLPRVTRNERIGAVVLLALGLYCIKVLHSPNQFVFADEFAHWGTASDILISGDLFRPNPLSAVSPQYPGLELVTAALVQLTGLSIHAAGITILAAARLLIALSLFLVLERVSRSARVAALAAVLYTANPNFLFWSAQYAYESLALPMAAAIAYLAVRRTGAREGSRLDPVMLVAAAALVVTHHLTTYALCAMLAVWAAVAWVMRRRGERAPGPPRALLLGLPVATVLWAALVAHSTAGYLSPVIARALEEVVRFLTGQQPIKTFFRGDPALVSPLWEQAVAIAGVAILAVTLALALVLWWRRARGWRRYRSQAVAWTFAVGALAYYPLQAVRALQAGTEISNRAWEFLFLPIGFVVAVAVHHVVLRRDSSAVRAGAVVVAAVVMFMSGVIVGLPRWARMPGPLLVSGDTRAIGPEGVDAAAWLRKTVGVHQGVVADYTNSLLMGSYGRQGVRYGLSPIYFTPRIDAAMVRALAERSVRYVVVDRRLSTMLPATGYYYESGEPLAGRHTKPMPAGQDARFDQSPGFRKVFDSGNIAIYEVEAAPSGFAPDRSATGQRSSAS